ncbi:hypothetical protein [uncultured Sphingomonas sp.]|uniref:hypothetical protein n=1 Tax=uncultured Sphingomonas sp. TaxID=158754 RepID=UPI0025CDF7F2|nr:hypothetical protein [uncultured Sphingomonas sp.]
MMFALFAAVAALSTPSPREESARPAAAAAVETAALPTAPSAAAKPTRYCFLNVEEDHIMRGKVCMTRKQWLWRGVEPLNYLGRTK